MTCRLLLPAAAGILAVSTAVAFADGIEAGLWKVSHTAVAGGVPGPPHQSTRCLTAAQVKDLAATFSPTESANNPACAPMQRSFDGKRLRWRLVCKGKIVMEVSAQYDFDSPHHYIGTTQSVATIEGQLLPSPKVTVEAEWVSAACPQ